MREWSAISYPNQASWKGGFSPILSCYGKHRVHGVHHSKAAATPAQAPIPTGWHAAAVPPCQALRRTRRDPVAPPTPPVDCATRRAFHLFLHNPPRFPPRPMQLLDYVTAEFRRIKRKQSVLLGLPQRALVAGEGNTTAADEDRLEPAPPRPPRARL